MCFGNPYYFHIYIFTLKLFLMPVLCFLMLNCYTKETKQILSTENRVLSSKSALDINKASAEELEKLPNIGAKTAQEIINHREKFGKFRKPEHLILIRGISDKGFREMKHLIKTE